MWGAAFPQMLTCTTSPHSVLLISSLVILPVCVWLSFSLALSQEAQTGPAEEEYMPQSSGHQPGPAEPQLCSQCQRCQPGWAHTALPKLLRSVCVPARVPKVCHVSLLFITTRLYKRGMREEWGGIQGERNGQGGREGGREGVRQRAVSYNQALFCWATEANELFPCSINYTNLSPRCLSASLSVVSPSSSVSSSKFQKHVRMPLIVSTTQIVNV